MTFATFPSWVVAVGAALLLALVTLLYRLRVRRTPVALAGATLWQQAVRQLPPRRLGGRWRRPLAWLLSLLLVLLLWLAAAGLRNPLADDGRRHVYYLDASAWLLGAGAFDAARAALERDVAARPAAQREVLLGDGMPSLLLAGDERTALLRARLRDSAARARPSGFPAWLASAGREGSDTLVHYYGAAPVLAAARGARPAGVQVEASFLAPPLAGNRGIVALGAAPAASGRWDAVDVLVALDAVGGPPPGRDALDVRLDGRPLPAGIRTVDDATGMLLTDVPAAGGTLQVALRQRDHFAADDAAALVLPMRRRLRVGVVGTLPPTLRDVLALDPSLQQVAPLQAQVLVVAADADADADAAAGAGVPALRLAAASGGAPAFRFTVRAATEQQALADHLGALGIDQARNTAIADELGRAVGVDVAQGRSAKSRPGRNCSRPTAALRSRRPCRCSSTAACTGWPTRRRGCRMRLPGSRCSRRCCCRAWASPRRCGSARWATAWCCPPPACTRSPASRCRWGCSTAPSPAASPRPPRRPRAAARRRPRSRVAIWPARRCCWRCCCAVSNGGCMCAAGYPEDADGHGVAIALGGRAAGAAAAAMVALVAAATLAAVAARGAAGLRGARPGPAVAVVARKRAGPGRGAGPARGAAAAAARRVAAATAAAPGCQRIRHAQQRAATGR
ncbi:hypothetical protein ACFQGW_07815 [Xanthomonas theicola]|uniref:hypothetical protein n=1 Tax=Xanthomonas theicola TaxID=56464 RepID=UPI00361831DF